MPAHAVAAFSLQRRGWGLQGGRVVASFMPNRNSTRVAIACEGGGSHTAFTAGALKALLRALSGQEGDPGAGVYAGRSTTVDRPQSKLAAACPSPAAVSC